MKGPGCAWGRTSMTDAELCARNVNNAHPMQLLFPLHDQLSIDFRNFRSYVGMQEF